jgi:hypothetical protein
MKTKTSLFPGRGLCALKRTPLIPQRRSTSPGCPEEGKGASALGARGRSDGHPIIENYVLVRQAVRHRERRCHVSCPGNIIAIIVRPASLDLSGGN